MNMSELGEFLVSVNKENGMELDGIYANALIKKVEGHMLANLEIATRQEVYEVVLRYIEVTINEIARNYYKRTDSDRKLNMHNVSLQAIRNKCGRYGPRGKQQYWWTMLHKLSPIINIIERGNNLTQQLTKVQAMFEHDWEDAAVWTIKEDYTAEPQAYDIVDIDLESLGNWMLQAHTFYKNKSTLTRVRKQAEQIFAIAEQFTTDGKWGQLPMLKRPALSGRMYYGGVNLQNCSSAVRHAALGRHFSYDLKRSVFSWQIGVLKQFVPLNTFGYPDNTLHTREFISNRDGIIEQLLPCFKDSYYELHQIKAKIKNAITAIGFGGRRSGGFVNESNEFVPKGLASIITHADSRKAFMNHPWVVEFVKEQTYISKTITQAFLVDDPDWRTDPRALRNGNYSEKVFLSNLYQSTEAKVMKSLMKHYEDKGILLWVHDGFCTRHRVPVGDAHAIMRIDHNMPEWILEETVHKGWADPDSKQLTPEEQRILNEQQDREERAQRHQAELAMWSNKGYDVSRIQHQSLPQFRIKNNSEGHYNDGVSDYDAGRDPYAKTTTGLQNEQQFIKRIYGS